MNTSRIIDANLNRLKEGIRVVEDIARYILEDKDLSYRLKNTRHLCKIDKDSTKLLKSRNIRSDILKDSTQSERQRENIKNIIIANFKRSEESARVLEEILKLESKLQAEKFKQIRYELYDIEIAYFEIFNKLS